MKSEEFKKVVYAQLAAFMAEKSFTVHDKRRLEWKYDLADKGRPGAFMIFKVKINWHGFSEKEGGQFAFEFSLRNPNIGLDGMGSTMYCGPRLLANKVDTTKISGLSPKIDLEFMIQYDWFTYYTEEDVRIWLNTAKQPAFEVFNKFTEAALSTDPKVLNKEIFFGSLGLSEWCKNYGLSYNDERDFSSN